MTAIKTAAVQAARVCHRIYCHRKRDFFIIKRFSKALQSKTAGVYQSSRYVWFVLVALRIKPLVLFAFFGSSNIFLSAHNKYCQYICWFVFRLICPGTPCEEKLCCWFSLKPCFGSQLEPLQGNSLTASSCGHGVMGDEISLSVPVSLSLPLTGCLKRQRRKTQTSSSPARPSFLWRRRDSLCVLQQRKGCWQQLENLGASPGGYLDIGQ